MIYLAVDDCCHGCKYFEVDDVVNGVGDHILMCSLRQKCFERRQTYLKSREGNLSCLGDCE